MLRYCGVTYRIDERTKCWIVCSHRPNKAGYIYINRRFKSGYLHRMIYNDKTQSLKPGERIYHNCSKKTCINPEHLYSKRYKGDLSLY